MIESVKPPMRIEDKELDSGVMVRHFTPAGADTAERPLVLIHGLGTSVENWHTFPQALGRQAMAIDVPRAHVLGDRPYMRDCAKLAVETIRHEVDDEPVDVLGYSWGGLLAEQIALDYPEQVGRLVLAATLPGAVIMPPSLAAQRFIMSANRSPEMLEKYGGAAYGGKVRGNWRLAAEVGIGKHTNPETMMRQKKAATWAWLNYFQLQRIQAPTLVLTGDDDPFVNPWHSEEMKEKIGVNAELATIEGEGHLVLLTSPLESAAVVNEFLDR